LFVFWRSFRHDFGPFPSLLYRSVGQSTVAALIAGVITYIILQLLAPLLDQATFLGIFIQGLVAGLGGLATSILILRRLGNKELIEISHSFRRKFWRRAQPILPVAEEL